MRRREGILRGRHVNAVDAALVGVLIGWVVAAWLVSRRPGVITPSRQHHGPPAQDVFAAFDPIGAHGNLDCAAYMRPLLRSLRALQSAVALGLDRPSYSALVAKTWPVYNRTNFGALDVVCAVDVATPADAAWSEYVRSLNAWLRCWQAGCTEARLTRSLARDWAKASDELEQAGWALRDLGQPPVCYAVRSGVSSDVPDVRVLLRSRPSLHGLKRIGSNLCS